MNPHEFFVVRGNLLVEVKGGCRQSGAVGIFSRGRVMLVEDGNGSIIAVLLLDCFIYSVCTNVP